MFIKIGDRANMNTLRQAYHNNKNLQKEIVSDASLAWIKENVIVINEKINRSTITRLINHIQKFENTFGDYKEKLPTISSYLSSAEDGLRLVVTGQTTEKRTSNMLEQLSYLYSLFSEFFTRDLPVLMRTNLFKTAEENPEISLLQLRYQSNNNIDIETIRHAFINAILPTKEEKKLLSRIYRATTLPAINAESIANELLKLNYNDLEALTKIGKVPMISTDVELETEKLTNENKNFVSESTLLMEVNVADIQPSMNAIKQVVSNAEVLEPLVEPVDNLQSKVLEVLASGDIKAYLGQAAQSDNPVNFLKNLFTTPKGKILAQANMVIETIKNIVKSWNQIQPLLNKTNPTRADISNIKKIITNAATGGVLSKFTAMFKTQPFPGLSPQEIVNVLSEPLEEYLQTAGFFGESNDQVINEQDIPNEAAEALEKFKVGMEQLTNAMKTKKRVSAPTTGTKAADVTTSTKETEQTIATDRTVNITDTPSITDSDDPTIVTSKALADAFKGKLKPQQLNQLTNILVKQGYTISKK